MSAATERLGKAMDAVAKANDAAGVMQRGGKKYTMVQDRVLAWRQTYGLEHGVEAEVIRDDGQIVQVRCQIRDADGKVIGTGHAEEVRGSSNVNKTSALENCETSALGRALASIGLHGGEYASANELDKVERIEQQPKKTKALVSWPTWVDGHIAGMAQHRDLREHQAWSQAVKDDLKKLRAENPDELKRLEEAYMTRKNELLNRSDK